MSLLQKLSLCLIVMLSASQINAQDLLIKTNNDSIFGIVKEIGDLEIKYTNPDVSETILFGIDKADVSKILLENGKELTFTKAINDPEKYIENHKNLLKVNFLSPLFNSLNFSYERSLAPGRSIEAAIGIIGVGYDMDDTNDQGVFAKIGYKFIKSPDYYLRGQRYAHLLKGAYIRPEIAISYYQFDEYYYYYDYNGGYDSYGGGYNYNSSTPTETNLMFAILLNFGKQWVIDNGFVVDTFIGFGYGFGNDDTEHGLHKAFIGAVDEFPLALTMGIRFGWCF
ncbi:hypothetical protein [Saccharicrinis aurantiacus]|uniref:hypothetical protein n=1 Tax=Saccharicrinis aurantiacus TaxID=1849719 RepID=UPI00094F9A14|nr:hypothetical protein [Saccharicrinis aurantiacus]